MLSNPTIGKFSVFLVSTLGVAFLLHTFLLQNAGYPKFDHKIIESYLVNGVLAATIFILLYRFRYKLKNYIGFLFMAGSFLKFIVFFLLFYPSYKADGDMSKLEFAAFFVPYAICLIWETVFTAKMLQKLD